MGYIYRIINTINNKWYIGYTKNYKKRWRSHILTLTRDNGCPALKAAINKYGLENFRFEIMVICFDEAMGEIEKEYIARYNTRVPNGYNISAGGKATCGFASRKHTDESKQLISQATRQRFTADARQKHSHLMKCIFTERRVEIVNKIRSSLLNSTKFKDYIKNRKPIQLSEEAKVKISNTLKSYYEHDDVISKKRETMTRTCGKTINQYDLSGNLIKTFASIAEASRQTQVPESTIRLSAKSNSIYHKKHQFYFRYQQS